MAERRGLGAQFEGISGSTFSVDSPEVGHDSVLAGAGVICQVSDAFSMFAGYDGQFARENFSSHSIAGGARVNF